MEEIEISRSDDDALFIRQKLNNYNNIFVQPDNHERLCLVVRRDDFIVGGLVGGTYWNWLYIELFWVDENERNNGLGTRILAKAEELAIQRGCRNAHLETHDFQSLGFYKRRAYVVFGELEDLPEGHTKFYMHKQLIKKKKHKLFDAGSSGSFDKLKTGNGSLAYPADAADYHGNRVPDLFAGCHLAVPKRGVLIRSYHRAHYRAGNFETPFLDPVPSL